MKTELATILVVEIGSITFFFLLVPFILTLARLRAIWQAQRATGLVLTVVVALTAFFFLLFFVSLAALTFSGA